MAQFGILSDQYVLFNSVAFAGRVKSALLTLGKEVIDITVAGNLARVRALGLEDHKLSLALLEDVAASGAGAVQATLLAAWTAGTPFAVNYRNTSGAISTTNPEFQCTYQVPTVPIGGQHGQYYITQVELISCSAMVIDTTP